MFFVIRAAYRPGFEDAWSENLEAHISYLKAAGPMLLAAGGLVSDDGTRTIGALYIVEVESRDEAQAFIAGDPFAAAGVFAEVEVGRWRRSFFDGVHRGSPSSPTSSGDPSSHAQSQSR